MATTNFAFTQLSGSETAGYTSINALIDSIDTQLYKRIPNKDASAGGDYNNMVPIYSNGAVNGFTQSLINTNNLANNAVTGAKIASGTITADKLDANLTTQILPSGMIVPFAGDTAPSGWLMCDGASKSRSAYPGLFSVISTTYGSVDGLSFNLPDMTGRIPVGKSADTEFNDLGETGGVKSVTLTGQQSGIAAHTHTVNSNTGVSGTNNTPGYTIDAGNAYHSHGTGAETANHAHTTGFRTASVATGSYTRALVASDATYTGTNTYGTSGVNANHAHNTDAQYATHSHTLTNNGHTHNVVIDNTSNTSASTAHTNLQPYITLNYIIKI